MSGPDVMNLCEREVALKHSYTFGENALCGLNFYHTYVEKTPTKDVSIPAARGSIAHSCADFLTGIALDREIPLNQITDSQIEFAIDRFTPPSMASLVGEVYDWIQKWRDRYRLHPRAHGPEQRIALDQQFQPCPWEEASWRGIVDMLIIDGTHCIILDYKGQKRILSQTELNEFEQTTHYCWLTWKRYGSLLKSFSAGIYYFPYGFAHYSTRTIEDLERYEEVLMMKTDKIRQIDNWEPSPGRACQYCEYTGLCPIANDQSEDNLEIKSQQQALRNGERYIAAKALVSRLERNVREYVNKYDEIALPGGVTLGMKPSYSTTYKVDEVDDVLDEFSDELKELKVHPSSVFSVDKKAIEKLAKTASKADSPLAYALEQLGEEKVSTRFTSYKTK